MRVALLEADVALPVARKFIDAVTEKAVGQQVLKSVTPGQQVVKIVNDELIEMLGGGKARPLELDVRPPAVILMVGLQGSGKTTTTAKLGKLIREKHGKKALMASLDVARPAAQEQLKVLGEQVDVATLPIVPGQQPVDIARRALEAPRAAGGRRAAARHRRPPPRRRSADGRDERGRRRLGADRSAAGGRLALTGQDAVNVAQSFSGEVPLTGVILTRMDGDARGGAALSMRAVTGKPIKFAGTGEKLDAIEPFSPERVAGRHPRHGRHRQPGREGAATIDKDEDATSSPRG